PGHLLLGEADLLTPELRQRQIFHLVRFASHGRGCRKRMHLLGHCCHLVSSGGPERTAYTYPTSGVPEWTAYTCGATRSGSPCTRNEQARTFRSRIRGQRYDPDVLEPRFAEHAAHVLVSETKPHVTHLLTVIVAVVRQPRSPSVQSPSANAASAARWKRSPNSSSLTRSH